MLFRKKRWQERVGEKHKEMMKHHAYNSKEGFINESPIAREVREKRTTEQETQIKGLTTWIHARRRWFQRTKTLLDVHKNQNLHLQSGIQHTRTQSTQIIILHKYLKALTILFSSHLPAIHAHKRTIPAHPVPPCRLLLLLLRLRSNSLP